jgi:hypothetical protein
MPYNGPMTQMSSDHGAGGDSGVFDMSDSPSLGGPGLGGMGIGGMGGMGGMGAAAGSYQGTLHKLGSVAAPEFSIQHEDFPTLGGGPPSRGGGPPGPGPPGGGPSPGPPGGDLGNPGGSPGYQGGVQHYGIPQQYEQPTQQPAVRSSRPPRRRGHAATPRRRLSGCTHSPSLAPSPLPPPLPQSNVLHNIAPHVR